ncbi:MAG: molybdate ABC transporter substrate-binding protein [Coriobacteriaceae bacterium]|jgi:molybdate transport system substrate-binding protein|nr:molybdate ABC transporter substrate-binding protein [Coriobacteriaceae bacterium]
MKARFKLLLVVFCVALMGALMIVGCTPKDIGNEPADTSAAEAETHESVELQIFAANSLSKALEAVQEAYVEEHSWVTFADTQYKSSGELNEMLAAGASADILISASKGKMDDAAEAGYIDPITRFDMFTNDLVMVSAENSAIATCTLEDIAAGMYTVAVGDESVPAGNYACQSLFTVDCYSNASGIGGEFNGALAQDGKVVLDTSVGNVCKHAESGEVDIAFVYSSDVYRFGGVKVVGVVEPNTHKPIVYPAALCADSENEEAAAAFLEWAFNDAKALKLWQEWGFELAS